MANKLSHLFDRQRFQQNPRLAKIIDDVESRYANALSDDALELVSAAGSADNGSDINADAAFAESRSITHETSEAWPEGSQQ